MEALDHLRSAGAEAKDAAAVRQVVHPGRRHCQQGGGTGVDRQDAGGDLHGLGLGGQVAHQADAVVAVGLGDVDDVHARLLQRLHLGDRLLEAPRVSDLHGQFHVVPFVLSRTVSLPDR